MDETVREMMVVIVEQLKAYVDGTKEIPDPASVRPVAKPAAAEPGRAPAEPTAVRSVKLPPAPPMPAIE